jgi:hypothetical protein
MDKKDRSDYMVKYSKRSGVKEKGRKCSREHMRNKRHPSTTKIKDLVDYLADIKKYPSYFPKEEFNKRLDDILENNPPEIKEKTLKDLIYDILDKEKILTPVMIIRIYNNSDWTNSIEEFMNERHYSKNGEEKYIPI